MSFEKYLGENLKSASQRTPLTPGVLHCHAECACCGSPWIRRTTFLRPHARRCSTTAETAYVAGPFSITLIAAIMPRAMSSISKIVNNTLLVRPARSRSWPWWSGTLVLYRFVCDVDRMRLWLVRSGFTNFGNSCGWARAWLSPLHSNRLERFGSWLSYLPELVRVLHQAHHSTTPNRASSAALSTSRLQAPMGQPNLLERATYDSPSSHRFLVFLTSSGVFVSLFLWVEFINCHWSRAENHDPLLAVHHSVISTQLRPRHFRELV